MNHLRSNNVYSYFILTTFEAHLHVEKYISAIAFIREKKGLIIFYILPRYLSLHLFYEKILFCVNPINNTVVKEIINVIQDA